MQNALNKELAARAEVVLSFPPSAADLRDQIQRSCDVFKERSSKTLSDQDLKDRVSTLMDFAEILEASMSANRVALPELADLMLRLKIPAKADGIISQESVTVVQGLVSQGRKFFGYKRGQVADTLSRLARFADERDAGTPRLLAQALRDEAEGRS